LATEIKLAEMIKILTALIFIFQICQSLFAQPTANFSVDRYNICSGSSLFLSNESTGADLFEWKIEGKHYSYSRDTVVVLLEPCYDLKEIRLIAVNTASGLMDSSALVVEVFDTCFFHWKGDYSWCVGDTVVMPVNPEEIATEFVISPPQPLISGCLTCPSLSFVLLDSGATVVRKSTYLGGCSELTSYHSSGCNPIIGTGADDNPEAGHLKIYPNPASQLLYIEAERRLDKIIMYNALGQRIQILNEVDGNQAAIDIVQLAGGVYYIRIEFESGRTLIRKIIKH